MPSDVKRGPSYPAYGLSEAIARAKRIFDVHGKRQIHADEAVQTWGYKGLSGPAARSLAGLRHYGLLDGTNNALRLSSDAVAILVADEGSQDRGDALARAARQPKIFMELLNAFPIGGGLPSDGALRAYLLRETDFGQNAASEVVESFRDSVSLAKLYDGPHDIPDARVDAASSEASGQATLKPQAVQNGQAATSKAGQVNLSSWSMTFAFSAPGSTHATIQFSGSRPDAKSAKMLANYLDLVKSAIEADATRRGAEEEAPEEK